MLRCFSVNDSKKIINETMSDRWEVALTTSDNDTFEQTSFVNGIFIHQGGSHVDTICKIIVIICLILLKRNIKKKFKIKLSRDIILIY